MKSIVGFVLLAVCGLLSTPDLTTAQDRQERRATPSDRSSDKIGPGVRESLTQDGRVRVIVALRQPDELVGASRARMGTIRQAVQAVQNSVVSQLDASDHQIRRAYKTIPAIATTVIRPEALNKLAANPLVLRIDLDEVEEAQLSGAAPLIHADAMHAAGFTGDGVVVAILDSGIDTDHPDLADDIIHEACFLDTNGLIDGIGGCPDGSDQQFGPGAAEDEFFHGTHISGIVTSRGLVSPVGIAPDAKIIAIKVLGADGTGTTSGVLAGLDYIIDSRPDVNIVNLSLGSGLYYGECDTHNSANIAYATAVSTLRGLGVTTFAGTGNSGSSLQMTRPACVSAVVSVGASDDLDRMASVTNTNEYTDIVAPGDGIVSASLGGGTASLSGTSMASAMAAGCAALVLDAGYATTAGSVEGFLKTSAVHVTDSTNGLSFPRIDCNGTGFAANRPQGLFAAAGPLDGVAACGGSGAYKVEVVHGVITRIGDTQFNHPAVGSSCWRFGGPYERVYITANNPQTFSHWTSPSGNIGLIDGHKGTSTTTIETSFNTNGNSPKFQAVHSGAVPTPDLLSVSSGGAGTYIGTLSGGSAAVYPAVAIHPITGVMYAGGGAGSAVLYKVDPTTGALTEIGPAGGGISRYGGMDFRSDGTLFAAVTVTGLGTEGANHLATINTESGAATVLGPFGLCSTTCFRAGMEGIAFDEGDTLYGALHFRTPSGKSLLYRVDASTGLSQQVAGFSGDVDSLDPGFTSLQFVNGTLYGGTALAFAGATNGGRLVEIDKATGVTSFVSGSSATGGRGLNALALGVEPPANDDLADAFVVGSLPYSSPGTTHGATSEADEAFGSCANDRGHSVWWSYTAQSNKFIHVNTVGSSINTILSTWSGSDHPMDEEIDCDDNDGGSWAARTYIQTKAGQTYYFRVVGFAGVRGPVVLNVEEVSEFDCMVQSEIPATECQALTSVYASTRGWDWYIRGSWAETNQPCSWFGVLCWGGHVVELKLPNNWLSGPIPSEIAQLTHLEELWLNSNDLSGPIPPGLGQLTSLLGVYLYDSNLSGSIPPELGQLGSLAILYLDNNRLSGPIPAELGDLAALETLDLSFNNLTGTIPTELGQLSSVEVLHLDGNRLTGFVPPELGELPALKYLGLSNNELSGAVPLPVAQKGATISSCELSGNAGLCMPNITAYQTLGNPICEIGLSSSCQPVVHARPTAFLEGPYAGAGSMATSTDFNGARPTSQPYSNPLYNGTVLDYDTPMSVAALPESTIDWVLVSLRTGIAASTEVAGSERAAVLLSDGSVVNADGTTLAFHGVAPGLYRLVLRHRNHLSVMSGARLDLSDGLGSWDFTTSMTRAYTTGPNPMKGVSGGRFAMFAADFDVDGQILASDYNAWLTGTKAALTGYFQTDFDLNGHVTATDFNHWLTSTKAAASSRVPE